MGASQRVSGLIVTDGDSVYTNVNIYDSKLVLPVVTAVLIIQIDDYASMIK